MLKDEGLRAYADLLQANGFSVYESSSSLAYFLYSQMVDGQECFGYVQADYFGGYSHTMPIKPSRQHGSSMFVQNVKDELTLEAARAVAQPSNYNRLVGTQQNYRDERWITSAYTKR